MKKNLNKLATLALTGMMVAGMNFGAVASTPFDATSVKIAKVLETDGKTYAPNTTFELNVNAGTLNTSENKQLKKSTGENGTEIKGYDLYNATAEQAELVTQTGATYSANGEGKGQGILNSTNNSVDITLDVSGLLADGQNKVTKPGVYVFDVSEPAATYEGVKNGTDAPTHMLVVVNNKSTGEGLEITNVLFAKKDGTKVESFTNYYGKSGDNDEVHDLIIKKKITGIGADKSSEFEFNLKVTPAGGYESERYSYWYEEGGQETGSMYTLVAGEKNKNEIKLSQTKAIHIYGLTEGDVVTVTEVKAGQDGYTTTYTVTGENEDQGEKQAKEMSSNGVGVNVAADGTVFEVTNNRDEIAVTGVAMNIAPYAAMVLGAGAFAGIFLGGKRREAENED